jgi:hypothetical protein
MAQRLFCPNQMLRVRISDLNMFTHKTMNVLYLQCQCAILMTWNVSDKKGLSGIGL